MPVPREHLIKRTTQHIIEMLLGRHTPEERTRILAEVLLATRTKK
jgi:hypothetical protein